MVENCLVELAWLSVNARVLIVCVRKAGVAVHAMAVGTASQRRFAAYAGSAALRDFHVGAFAGAHVTGGCLLRRVK